MDRAYWDRVADRFDDEVLKILDHDRSGMLADVISKIASLKKSAADFGCGNGSLLPLLSRLFRDVQAIDTSGNLLADAQRHNSKAPNIRYKQADLSEPFRIDRKVDVLLCVNLLIQPSVDTREKILENAVASLKRRGTLVLVVPAFESLLHTYHTIVEINVALGMKHEKAVAEIESVYRDEVISAVEGIVTLGTEPTKMHTQEEVRTALSDQGLTRISSHRIEYDWAEMIDHAPEGLGAPYPWDWLFVARKS